MSQNYCNYSKKHRKCKGTALFSVFHLKVTVTGRKDKDKSVNSVVINQQNIDIFINKTDLPWSSYYRFNVEI